MHIIKPKSGEEERHRPRKASKTSISASRLSARWPSCDERRDGAVRGAQGAVVERFDRRWTGDGGLLRLPQEDCCQALWLLNFKHESDGGPGIEKIAELLKGKRHTRRGPRPLLQGANGVLAARLVPTALRRISASSAPGGRFRLAPLYDVMSTQPTSTVIKSAGTRCVRRWRWERRRHYVVDSITARHYAQTAARRGFLRGIWHASSTNCRTQQGRRSTKWLRACANFRKR